MDNFLKKDFVVKVSFYIFGYLPTGNQLQNPQKSLFHIFLPFNLPEGGADC
jgi:hypothetical protein